MTDDDPGLKPWRIAQEEARALASEARRYATLTRPATLARATEHDPSWRDRAACVDADPADFYAESGSAAQDRALATCAGCPVQVACGNYADALADAHGIWGGRRPQDRAGAQRGARRLAQRVQHYRRRAESTA